MNVSQFSTAAGLILLIGGGGASLSLTQSTAAAADERSLGNAVAIADLVEMLRDEREEQKLASTAAAAKDAERIRMTAKFCAIDGFRTTNAIQCAMNDIEREESS